MVGRCRQAGSGGRQASIGTGQRTCASLATSVRRRCLASSCEGQQGVSNRNLQRHFCQRQKSSQSISESVNYPISTAPHLDLHQRPLHLCALLGLPLSCQALVNMVKTFLISMERWEIGRDQGGGAGERAQRRGRSLRRLGVQQRRTAVQTVAAPTTARAPGYRATDLQLTGLLECGPGSRLALRFGCLGSIRRGGALQGVDGTGKGDANLCADIFVTAMRAAAERRSRNCSWTCCCCVQWTGTANRKKACSLLRRRRRRPPSGRPTGVGGRRRSSLLLAQGLGAATMALAHTSTRAGGSAVGRGAATRSRQRLPTRTRRCAVKPSAHLSIRSRHQTHMARLRACRQARRQHRALRAFRAP